LIKMLHGKPPQPLSGGCVLKQTTSTVLAIDFASCLQATVY
jgi:hypothetical protein